MDETPLDVRTRGSGPLAGLRVLELGMLIAGPFAGRLLGDMGAEVIKIEAPDKLDAMRDWGVVRYEGRSLWWPVQSRNKKCITLDLRAEQGQRLMLELVRRSDVVIENFRPGTLEKWNLGFDQLQEANPKIILARISGFGQTGPYADRAGFASVAEAMGGLRHLNGYPGQAPSRFGFSLGDSLAGMFTVHGVLAALYQRDVLGNGRGQVIDVSLMESCFSLLESVVPEYDRVGAIREPSGTGLDGIAPSNIFKSRDGTWVVIGANNDNLFRRLCAVMGQPELADDPRFKSHRTRGEHRLEIERIVADWAALHDAAELVRLLNDAHVVCGRIYTVADIFEDPQYRARQMLVDHEDPEFGTFIGPGVVPKFSATPGAVRWSGVWKEGAHNRDVYGDMVGLSDEELDALEKEGVL
jgi:formyl-CoA transferase